MKKILTSGAFLRGIVMVCISFALTVAPEHQTEILSVGTAVLGALGVGISEQGAKA